MYDQFGNFVPEWVDMGEDNGFQQGQQMGQSVGTFADALKRRFMKPAVAPEHGVLGHPEAQVAPHMIEGAAPMGHEAKFGGGGGVKSL